MNDHIAFLDEWGNNDLDFAKHGVSTHFIITALTLRKEQLQAAEFQLESIRKQFFQTGVALQNRT